MDAHNAVMREVRSRNDSTYDPREPTRVWLDEFSGYVCKRRRGGRRRNCMAWDTRHPPDAAVAALRAVISATPAVRYFGPRSVSPPCAGSHRVPSHRCQCPLFHSGLPLQSRRPLLSRRSSPARTPAPASVASHSRHTRGSSGVAPPLSHNSGICTRLPSLRTRFTHWLKGVGTGSPSCSFCRIVPDRAGP